MDSHVTNYVHIVVLVIIFFVGGRKICPFDNCPWYSPQEEVLELRDWSKSIGGWGGGGGRNREVVAHQFLSPW